jgi:hypothetical protein
MTGPLVPLGVQEYADGTKGVVVFGYTTGGKDNGPVARYQIEVPLPVTAEAIDAKRDELRALADAVDALNEQYRPKVIAPAGGLTLM